MLQISVPNFPACSDFIKSTTSRLFAAPKKPLVTSLTKSRFNCISMTTHNRSSSSSGLTKSDGVIIVDHGSRVQDANSMLDEFVEMYKRKTGHSIVEPAHMELARPTIKDAFDSCADQGAERVIISPYFLAPGRHWKKDIPGLAAEAAKDHPGIPYFVTAPIGLHELMVDVIQDRIEYCLKHISGDAPECEICSGTGQCKERIAQ